MNWTLTILAGVAAFIFLWVIIAAKKSLEK